MIDEKELEKQERKVRRAQRKAAREAQRSPAESRAALRLKERIFYDLQRLRIQSAGRGLTKGEDNLIQLNEADVSVLNSRAEDLRRAEKQALGDIEDHLSTMPIYRDVLNDKSRFKGLGPTMAAVILSEFEIERLETVSQMWAFAGFAPVPARRCKTCNLIVKVDGDGYIHEYKRGGKLKPCSTDTLKQAQTYASGKAAKPTKGEKLPYNAFLRAKLVGVLGPCLLKANSPWRKFYDDYKHRKESAGWGVSDGHRHNAAIRYMVKMLLLEIWREWRAMEGLPVRESYQEQYLGHRHSEKMAG